MKNRTHLPQLFLGIITALLYLPILLMVIYSFNESKLSSVWSGFSLKWYKALFQDSAMFEALSNSLILALSASFAAAIIGTLGAYGFSRIKMRSKSLIETISMLPIMTPEINALCALMLTATAVLFLLSRVLGRINKSRTEK